MIRILHAVSMVISAICPIWKYAKLHLAVKAGITSGAFPWFFGRGIDGIEDAAIFVAGVVALFWLTTTGKVLVDRY